MPFNPKNTECPRCEMPQSIDGQRKRVEAEVEGVRLSVAAGANGALVPTDRLQALICSRCGGVDFYVKTPPAA